MSTQKGPFPGSRGPVLSGESRRILGEDGDSHGFGAALSTPVRPNIRVLGRVDAIAQ